MDKSPDAFRTISEVAGDLDLPQHVLRFWETRFVQIKPLKRGGGRRYYRPDDIDLLKGIRHLLYGEGYTIRGVQRILKEQGVRFVMEVWHEGAPQPPPAGARWAEEPRRAEDAADDPDWNEDAAAVDAAAVDDLPEWAHPHAAALDAAPDPDMVPHLAPDEIRANGDAAARQTIEPTFAPVPPDLGARPVAAADHGEPENRAAQAMAQRFAPPMRATPTGERLAPTFAPTPSAPVAAPRPATVFRPMSTPVARAEPRLEPARAEPTRAEPARPASGFGHLMERLRPTHAVPEPVDPPGGARPALPLSRDEIRRLQATLFELLECKRLLDQIR